MKVVRLDQVANTGHRTVAQLLQDESEREWSEGEVPKKAIILYLDDGDGQYYVSWAQAGLKMSECVSLCELGKERFKSEMNY